MSFLGLEIESYIHRIRRKNASLEKNQKIFRVFFLFGFSALSHELVPVIPKLYY